MKDSLHYRPRSFVAAITALLCGIGLMLVPASSSAQLTATGNTPAAAASSELVAAAPGSWTSRVRGTFGSAGTVRGTFKPVRFFVHKGDPYGYGVLTATLRRGDGSLVGTTTRKITIPLRNATNPGAGRVASPKATCDILHLVLGPLDLNLLGLKVHLTRVVLDIVAETGPGNLLGNLLCAVTGLFDNTGLLGQLRLSNVLNRILNILRIA